jgi:hypothetical protein
MMKSIFGVVFVVLMLARVTCAVQTTVTEASGYSCMGDEKSKKQTEDDAMINAKKNAAEYTATYVKSETQVKNYELQKDIVTAYTNAEVTAIEDVDKGWYKDPSAGDCYKIRIKAEVTPDEAAMAQVALASGGTTTEGSFNVPVAPPPLPGAAPADGQSTAAAATPDVVVVPSGNEYVYMAPNTTGIYFYNGFWYRSFEGFWFRSMAYGRRWGTLSLAAVPQAVMNVPPEYPRYLPHGYERIHYNDLQMKWHDWARNREWNRHEWFKNELRRDVAQERLAQIKRERDARQVNREHYHHIKEEARLHPQPKVQQRPVVDKKQSVQKNDVVQKREQKTTVTDKNRPAPNKEIGQRSTQKPMLITQDMVEGRTQKTDERPSASNPAKAKERTQKQAKNLTASKQNKAQEKIKKPAQQRTIVAKQSKTQQKKKKPDLKKKEPDKKEGKAEHAEHKKD